MRKFSRKDLATLIITSRDKNIFDVFDSVYKLIERLIETKGAGMVIDKRHDVWVLEWKADNVYSGTVAITEDKIHLTYNWSRSALKVDEYFTQQSVETSHELGKLVPFEDMAITHVCLLKQASQQKLQVTLEFVNEQSAEA